MCYRKLSFPDEQPEYIKNRYKKSWFLNTKKNHQIKFSNYEVNKINKRTSKKQVNKFSNNFKLQIQRFIAKFLALALTIVIRRMTML